MNATNIADLASDLASLADGKELDPADYRESVSDQTELDTVDVYTTDGQVPTSTGSNAVTPATVATKDGKVYTGNGIDFPLDVATGYSKVTAGEFDDVVTIAAGMERRRTVRAVWDGAVASFRWIAGDKALGYVQKLARGDEIDFVLGYTVGGVRFFVRHKLIPFNVQYDQRWNGYVMLEQDNNVWTPIRVHYSVLGSSALWDNENNIIVNYSANGWSGVIANWDGVNTISDRKLEIDDVNSYDMQLLKSDYAKGKNLQLNYVYKFYGDAGKYTAYTAWNDTDRLWIDDFSTEKVGKVDTISARLFKETKVKLVKAEYAKFIHNGAFRKNKQLKKVIIGTEASAKKINEKAFYDCKKLKTAKIGVKTIKRVGKSAFGGSTDKKGLKFNLKGNKTQYNKAVKLLKKSGVKKAKFRKI